MQLFDSHAHLLDARFDDDREALLARLPAQGITGVIEVGCEPASFAPALALAEAWPYIWAAVGIHPHNAGEATEADYAALAAALAHPRAVALGEIGLDYHYDFAPRETQKACFCRQLDLARQRRMPVILHIREAYGDCMDILHAHADGLCGVAHCFSGSAEIARACVDLGLYIAFGGALTFSNARRALESAAVVPLDRLLLETDAPYMTPVPHRGHRNDPSLMHLTLERLAALRGLTTDDMAAITAQNARDLFRLG